MKPNHREDGSRTGLELERLVNIHIHVDTRFDVILTAQDRDVKADFEVVSKLTEGNYRNQTYGLKDSSLKLENVQILTDAERVVTPF